MKLSDLLGRGPIKSWQLDAAGLHLLFDSGGLLIPSVFYRFDEIISIEFGKLFNLTDWTISEVKTDLVSHEVIGMESETKFRHLVYADWCGERRELEFVETYEAVGAYHEGEGPQPSSVAMVEHDPRAV